MILPRPLSLSLSHHIVDGLSWLPIPALNRDLVVVSVELERPVSP
jgi:hypothetical protein